MRISQWHKINFSYDQVETDLRNGRNLNCECIGGLKLENENLVVTINNFVKGDFGVIAFGKLPVPKNGNIHSQKEADLKKDFAANTGFNHNNVLTVPCSAGNTIYLYIHCGTIQFFIVFFF